MIELQGEEKANFLEFLKEAYPELHKTVAVIFQFEAKIKLHIDSPLGQAWSEYDENCG